MKKMILLLLCLFIIVGWASAQVSKVSGTVVSKEDGLPIIGASVVIDGTSISTMTDFEGKFIFKDVPSSSNTLTVSFVGMKSVKVSIAPEMTIQLKQESNTMKYGKNKIIVGYSNFYFDNVEEPLTGFSVGYSRIFDIFTGKPYYLEVGALFQYGTLSIIEEDSWEEKVKYAKINIPISIIYSFNIGNSDFFIYPKAGINISYNTLFESKCVDYEYNEETVDSYFDIPELDTKRFTYGWHIGAELAYKNYILGVNYAADINKIVQVKDSANEEDWNVGHYMKGKTFSVTLAYSF